MKIRPYIQSDRPAVIALWREDLNYTSPHNDPQRAIERKLAVQPELFFIATVDEELAGTVMAGYDGHRGWIYSLAVVPRLRRRGIATALMRHAEQALAALGCPKINLQAFPTNSAAVAFYRKLGYNVEERVSMGKVMAPPAI